MAKVKQNTAQTAERLAQPALLQLGLRLWDVRFEKEGGSWFLRYYIDKDGGVNISDCEQFSHLIDPILDAADPIEGTYSLEVSSPGIERELTKSWHFEKNIGRQVTVRLIRAKNGVREISGALISYKDGTAVILDTQSKAELAVAKGEAAYIRLQYDFDYDKGAVL